ncbi:MAG: hypothetical protein M1817_001442 [Caeruleum heppii]|nr:MAG: hypothetical protein M1817_001442 [Caeruleum heppii]
MSGTTALTSHSAQEAANLVAEDVLDFLPDLASDTERLLDLVAPETMHHEHVRGLIEDLAQPGAKVAKRLNAIEKVFRIRKESYGTDHYINLKIVTWALCGDSTVEMDESLMAKVSLRLSFIVQGANLATLASQLVHSNSSDEDTHVALQQLDSAFPDPFMTDLCTETENMHHPGCSSLRADTTAVALNIRTQLAIMMLAQDMPHHDVDSVLRHLFFEEGDDDEMDTRSLEHLYEEGILKDWAGFSERRARAVPQVKRKDPVRDQFLARIRSIRRAYDQREQDPRRIQETSLERLRSEFPWTVFVSDVIKWSRLRFSEIQSQIENVGGAELVMDELRAHVQAASHGEGHDVDAARSSRNEGADEGRLISAEAEPLADTAGQLRQNFSTDQSIPAAPKSFNTPRAISTLRKRESALPSDRSSTGITGAVPAITSIENQVATTDVAPETTIQETTGNDEQDDWRPQSMNEDDMVSDNHYGTTQQGPRSSNPIRSADDAISRYIHHQHEKNKENLRHKEDVGDTARKKQRFFNQSQENAGKVLFDDEDVPVASRTRMAHDRGENGVSSASKARETSQQDDVASEVSQDEGFEVDNRVVDPIRRTVAPPVSRLPPVPASQSSPERRRVDTQPQSPLSRVSVLDRLREDERHAARHDPAEQISDLDELDNADEVPRISTTQVNNAAKRYAASMRPMTVQVRRPWDQAAADRLVELIQEQGTSWTMIEKLKDPLLEGRGQVALKDKARNIKMDILKTSQDLPQHFENVRLNRLQIETLRGLGIPYEQ